MKIIPTFDPKRNPEECTLWSVCYEEDRKDEYFLDIFTKLFQLWNDFNYLQAYFEKHRSDLEHPFWNNISLEDAIFVVLDQAADFQDELMAIEYKMKGYENLKIKDVFKTFHQNEFLIKPREKRETIFRKGKPYFNHPILRLYGIELEDGSIVITGGGIKLTRQLEPSIRETELKRLRKVQDFLKSEHINSKEDFEL